MPEDTDPTVLQTNTLPPHDDGMQESRDALRSMLQRGIVVHTDLSGMLCAESGMALQLGGMRRRGAKVTQDRLGFWAGCDIAPIKSLYLASVCSDVLRAPRHPRVPYFNVPLVRLLKVYTSERKNSCAA